MPASFGLPGQFASHNYAPVGVSPVGQPKKPPPPPPPPTKPVEPLACDSILLDLESFKKPGRPGPSTSGVASPAKKRDELPRAPSEPQKPDAPKVSYSRPFPPVITQPH